MLYSSVRRGTKTAFTLLGRFRNQTVTFGIFFWPLNMRLEGEGNLTNWVCQLDVFFGLVRETQLVPMKGVRRWIFKMIHEKCILNNDEMKWDAGTDSSMSEFCNDSCYIFPIGVPSKCGEGLPQMAYSYHFRCAILPGPPMHADMDMDMDMIKSWECFVLTAATKSF